MWTKGSSSRSISRGETDHRIVPPPIAMGTCCPRRCCAQSARSGKQFLPLDSSTLLPGVTFRPLLLQVRIRNGYGSKCGYPQTYVRVTSYSSQSVAGVATLRVPAATLVSTAGYQEGLRTLALGTAFPPRPICGRLGNRPSVPFFPSIASLSLPQGG